MAAVAYVGAMVIGGISAYEGHEARKDAQENYNKSADEQRKAQNEQRALRYQDQATERRNQVREERVRRAKILQAAENTGVGGSSGLYGAVSGLTTQLNNNLAINEGKAEAGDRIGGYLQNAADFNTAAQNSVFSAQNADQLFSLSTSIFSASGGFKGK